MLQDKIPYIAASSENLSIADTIRLLDKEFPGRVVFSSSFSFEDQVITHEILSNNIPVTIFTLDTGRLFPET
ncbi:MAG: phosphoadenylyl-sulfate reductase, partial [Chitinophagaceae bacterium]|nr:phosphoadenylyl-sulfate reductase [Chitinophagaceae bacterium]